MDKSKINHLEKIIEEQYINTAGIVIMKNDNLVYEKYFNGYTQEDTIHIASVTKSIISSLIGLAIDKGYIKSVNQKVLDFFPDYTVKRGEKTIQMVTIQNMLTMTAPSKKVDGESFHTVIYDGLLTVRIMVATRLWVMVEM